MDNNFQTSFIPHKPLAEERAPKPRHASLLGFFATLIFVISMIAAGGMYFYKKSLAITVQNSKDSLVKFRDSFEPSSIAKLKNLDSRMNNATELINNHVMISPIFTALEAGTLKSIQFTKFSYVTPTDTSAPVTILMTGKARDYTSIALQSDEFAKNKNIHNSIFSNLALEEKTGMVNFDLSFTVDASMVRFINHLADLTKNPGAPVTPATPAQTTPPLDTTTTPPGPGVNNQ